jgi:hypothetical protein
VTSANIKTVVENTKVTCVSTKTVVENTKVICVNTKTVVGNTKVTCVNTKTVVENTKVTSGMWGRQRISGRNKLHSGLSPNYYLVSAGCFVNSIPA